MFCEPASTAGYESARRCATRVLEVEPENAKALFRRALSWRHVGRLSEAEADLQKASQVSDLPEVCRELAAVRKLQSEDDSSMLRSGFLEAKPEEVSVQPEAEEVEQSAWAVTEQVQDALQDAYGFLEAVAVRRVAVRSAEERQQLCEHADRIGGVLQQVRQTLEEATIVPPPDTLTTTPVAAVEVTELLRKMLKGLRSFRPFFSLQERSCGEFRSLRVCRQLGTEPWSLDVELICWGDAEEATPETFASALLGPSGKATSDEVKSWQRQLFDRIFLKDASQYVAGACWLLLTSARASGLRLQHEGEELQDLGLAEGVFFSPLRVEGPSVEDAPKMGAPSGEMLALLAGKDKRLIPVPSFTSLGVTQRWLLGKLPSEGHTREIALDPTSSALGLEPLHLATEDERYHLLSSHFGSSAAALVAGVGHRPLLLAAVSALAPESKSMEAAVKQLEKRPPNMTEMTHDDSSRALLPRLVAAVEHLGLCRHTGDFEELRQAATEELVLRKLRAYGFAKAATQLESQRRRCSELLGSSPICPRLLGWALAFLCSSLSLAFAVERQAPGGLMRRSGDNFRTLKSKASWRLKEEGDDKHRLLMKLRDPQTRRRERAETVAALQQRRLLTEAREYTVAIKALGQLGLWREAVGMLSDMERNGVPPDTITYNAAIMALSLNKRWKEAVELIAEMWAAKIFPDVISYTSAISACASTGHWKEALQLLAEMERAGIKADVRIFNAAINACAQAGQSSRALQLLDGMSERLLVPDIVSYNAAINACAQNGEYESAFKLLERMKSQGLRPQTRTYNSALNACEKAFRAEETLQLLDDMVETKTRPDIVTFNTAMSACLKGGMQGQALSLLEDVSGVGRPEMAPWAPVVGSRDVGDRYVGREEEIEPAHPVCTQALELNVDVLTVMVDELDGQFISIDDLKPEVKKLFEDVNYEPGAREVYIAAWDLRQLYTFAFRRQNDAAKRNQLESDCFEAASPAPSPDPTLKSGNVPQYREKRSASSLASEVTPKASDEPTMVGSPGESQLQLDVLGEACSVPMTAEQQKELDSVLHQLHMMSVENDLAKGGQGRPVPCPALRDISEVEPEQVANLPAEVEVKGNEIQNNTVEPASGKGSGVDAEAKGEVLMMAVVLLAFTEGLQWDEIYDAAEIFAGKGVLSRCLLAGGYATASLDILHFTPWLAERTRMGRRKLCKGNALDLTSPAGFGLLLSTILRSKPSAVFTFGLVCSSFVAVSRGTTHRSFFLPLGDPTSKSVQLGNILCSRMVLAMILMISRGMVFVLEQPSSSLAYRHPRFQQLLKMTNVWRQAFWMRGWGSNTPKRTILWSNSRGVRKFATHKKYAKGKKKNQLATVYIDSNGKKRYQGNSRLKGSQVYPVGFGIRFTRTMPLLQKEKSKPNTIAEDKVPTIDEIKPNDVLPCLDSMDDLWRDARMSDVLHYLYGGTGVQLPDDWTQFAMTIPLPLKQDPGNVESEAAVKTTTEEENAHDDDPSSEKKSRKLESALRRVCTPKRGSGKLEVSQDIYKKWLAGGSQRKALLDEAFKKHIEHMQRRSRKTKIHVDSGFYTKENMKKKLGWSATRIAKAVQYCTHPSRVKTHVRRDKYESNVKEYWVDVETTGSFDNEHEESLTDRTCVEGQAATFDLGIQPVMTLLRTKPVPKEKAASAKNKAAKAAAKASAEPRKRAKRDQEALEAPNPNRATSQRGFQLPLAQQQKRFVMMAHVYSGKKGKKEANPKPLLRLVDHLATELRMLFEQGLDVHFEGALQRIWLVPIAFKGDWPALVKIGQLNRHHLRDTPTKEGGHGICHLCKGGMPSNAWHDVSFGNMTKMRSELPMPWQREPGIVSNLALGDAYEHLFFRIDLFHTCHKGVMADAGANAVLALVDFVYENESVEKCLELIYSDLKAFCRAESLQLHLQSLTRTIVGYANSSAFPAGNWFKGADTVSILAYLEQRLAGEIPALEDKVREYFVSMAGLLQNANLFMRTVYHGALWLDDRERDILIQSGRAFMAEFMTCARLAYSFDMCRWKLQPKYHMFAELVFELEVQKRAGITSLSPLTFSTQMDEDLVGQICSRSQVVSSRTVHERTLNRYRVALFTHW
ncbi:unnamed protein product [Durusdinium trenchii]|uniref:PROP1-like PPR domain-containing protein n=1 Tax=Durusdinium trenchii TaxID=1381693 RepID=A0ABP0SIV1_9DINO